MTQPPGKDPKSVWQNQETRGETMSAREVCAKAQKIDAENRRDVNIGFTVALVLTLFGLYGLATVPSAGVVEARMVFVLLLCVWFGAWRSTKARTLATGAEPTACVDFYRKELERRRDYYARPPWLLLALIIFAFLQFVFLAFRFGRPGITDLLLYPIMITVVVLVSWPLWRRQARKFQRELDALDAFEKDAD